jgi:hypothetical protein
MSDKNQDFGKFITRLAKSELEPATQATLDSLKEKLKAEQQAEIERKLRAVFTATQRWVTELNAIRAREKGAKMEILKLEKQANDIIAGKA